MLYCLNGTIEYYCTVHFVMEYSFNSDVIKLAVADITSFAAATSNTYHRDLEYKGFVLRIVCANRSYYCGYVVSFPEDIEHLFSSDERECLENIYGLPEAHLDWTAGSGFDCAHICDIQLQIVDNSVTLLPMRQLDMVKATFKTQHFVESKLKQTADHLLSIASQRLYTIS